MSDSIKTGTLIPLLQSETYQFDPLNGDMLAQVYANFSPQQMQILAGKFRKSGTPYQLTIEQERATLITQYTNPAITMDSWQVVQTRMATSPLLNPRNIAAIDSDNDIKVIGYAVNKGITLQKAVEEMTADGVTPTPTVPSGAAALRLFKRMSDGLTSYDEVRYVLQHTTNVSNRYASNVSDENVRAIYTFSQLFSEVQSVNLWVFPLPSRLVYKLQLLNFEPFAPPARDNYRWGWLKGASSETSAANNRIDITTEYELGQWSTDEYLAL